MSLKYQNDADTIAEAANDTAPVRHEIPYYTYALLGCVAAVMSAQLYSGLDRSISIAGFDKPEFIRHHEYWRIITGAALHGSLLHVGMNGYALYSFGKLFEILTNRAHLAIVFLLSAVGGGLLSLIFLPNGISVGASGGIVGLIGYLAVYAFRRKKFISREFRNSLLINIGFILIVGIAILQNIDNFGHIGGLMTGAIYGFFQIPEDEYIDPRAANSTTQIFGLTAFGIYAAASLFSIVLFLYG